MEKICQSEAPTRTFRAPVVVLHGGCGGAAEQFEFNERRTLTLPPTLLSSDAITNLRGEQLGIRQAALRAWQVLKAGGSAIDAVQEAVVIMEDNPEFNAGIGSSLTRDKVAEMDALIVEGQSLRMGSVCSVKNVKNPIKLARYVMDNCAPHVMFSAEDARQLAIRAELQMLKNEQFYSEKSLCRWNDAHDRAQRAGNSVGRETGATGMATAGTAAASASAPATEATEASSAAAGSSTGTVGAVAIDLNGLLASATSTGGLTYKAPGRVGDTPCIGCGGFADNESAAVSATGIGETIMRVTLCRLAASFVENAHADAQAAVEQALAKLQKRLGVGAGLIAVDRNGVPGVHYTTECMTWAVVDSDGLLHFGTQPNEHLVENLSETN